jgi:hypothetical protein
LALTDNSLLLSIAFHSNNIAQIKSTIYEKTDLDILALIANIVSSVTLIISIIILVNEYRSSEVVNEKAIEDLIYERMLELDRLVIENPDLGDIIHKARFSPDDLSTSESLRYLAFEHIFYDSWETLWVGFQNGIVSQGTWEDWNEWFIRAHRKKPAMAWKGNLENFSSDILQYMEKDLNATGK